MNLVHYKNRIYTLPGEWNELSKKQLILIVEILYSESDMTLGMLRIFKVLSGISWYTLFFMTGCFKFLWLEKWLEAIIIPASMQKYLDRCNRLMEAIEECCKFLALEEDTLSLTKNIIENYRGFAGPSSELHNLKAGEFCFTEYFFTAWKSGNDIKMLNNLVATLFRPRRRKYNHSLNPDGDHREAFNPNLTDGYALKVAKWPLNVKIAIALFYQGNRNAKVAANPEVFNSDSEGQESLYGLWSVIRGVAKSSHLGDFDKVQDQYLDTILMELNEVVAEAKKLEEEIEASKHKA